MELFFSAAIEDEGGPLGASMQKRAPNYASAAVVQKITVVSNWRKADREDRQVRVEKVNESEPTEDAPKTSAAVGTAVVFRLRERAGRVFC